MKFDKYTRKARIFPSIIVLIPIIVFITNSKIETLNSLLSNLIEIKIIGTITISIALLYLLVYVTRFLGKFVFERKMYKIEKEMPTTKFLLSTDNTFSNEYKLKIKEKILADFKIDLIENNQESDNIENTKSRIVEAVGLIRLKVKDGTLLLQHNIEYGFARNLIGGTLIAIPFTIFETIYFFIKENSIIAWFSVLMFTFFLFILVFHKYIINHLGNQYAKRLYQEYLQI